ncbi:hypothetical protein Ancab_021473 [Ancistrocladus abbreviatus]
MERAAILGSSNVQEAVGSCANGPLHVSEGNVQESENVGDDIVQHLDLYFLEINDRLTISRMVSDSVVKGIVNAVSREADARVAAKELQVVELKEALRILHLSYDELNMSKTSLHEWQPENELQKQIESLVIRDTIKRLQVWCKGKLRDKNVDLYGNETVRWSETLKEISSLRHELDAIHKTLFNLEVGHLSSQGSLEMDHSHHNVVSNHVLANSALWDGNGKPEESKINMPENFESSQLRHLNVDGLYNYFRTEIIKMKRDHESTVQQMTEDYFSLKRELLKEREHSKERGPFPPFKKDKDFDNLKKKISEVIRKLDDILSENENVPEICDFSGNRLDSLLSENLYLKDLLANKDREIKYLSLKVSKDAEKLSQNSLVEENLCRLIGELKCSVEDAHLEATINEEVYKCILKEIFCQFQCDDEEADVKSGIMQEVLGIIYEEAAHKAEATMKIVESLIMQGISGVVVEEVLKDLEIELKDAKVKCLQEFEHIGLLKKKVFEMGEELIMADEEKKRLKHETMALEAVVEGKDKAILEVTTALEKQREQFELANKELTKLMDCTKQQEALLFRRDGELEMLRTELESYLLQIDLLKAEKNKLIQELDEERVRFLDVSDTKEKMLLLVEAEDREHRKLMESQVHIILELLKEFNNFERVVAESIKWSSLRLENSTFQLNSIIRKANVLQRTRLLYRQRLEKRCSDLQKAEAEVDILGDEVDALLGLLEKIYIALDHYAPILEHYPGIMEILKLVKRELSGESTRAMFRIP